MKKYFGAMGSFAAAGLISWIFTTIVNTVIIGSTPLVGFEYEQTRALICQIISLVIFYAMMSLKPLIDYAKTEAATPDELKEFYKKNTRTSCIAYLTYLILLFVMSLLIPIINLCDFLFVSVIPLPWNYFLLSPFVSVALFYAVIIPVNYLFYRYKRWSLFEYNEDGEESEA